MASRGRRTADQCFLWDDIAHKHAHLSVASRTEAMADLYEAREEVLAGFQAAFWPAPGQVGAVFAIDAAVRGVELLDSARTFAKFLDKLAGSYAMDAIDTDAPDTALPAADAAARFLARIGAASARAFPGLGKGEDVRLEGEGLAGGALLAQGRVVHLAAFAVNGVR
jgi:hypothetical protein